VGLLCLRPVLLFLNGDPGMLEGAKLGFLEWMGRGREQIEAIPTRGRCTGSIVVGVSHPARRSSSL
jgi:hypothetical protein